MSKTATIHAQQKWEYMELTRKTEGYLVTELNELGQAGWEMVSVLFHKDTKSGLGESMVWTAFLKRPHTAHAPAPGQKPADAAGQTPSKPAQQPQPAQQPVKPAPDEKPEIFEFES